MTADAGREAPASRLRTDLGAVVALGLLMVVALLVRSLGIERASFLATGRSCSSCTTPPTTPAALSSAS